MRDKPWIFRTYAGHSTAKASNALYRENLSRGQTGLSVAFDLPTQTGYDSDDPRAKGEVGKVGVPVSHLGDMRTLFDGIPLGTMNTSMTINATAPWLLALYIAVADETGVARKDLQGTTQNDIIKEYLSRGTYIYPPKPSLKLTADTIAFTYRELPKWNPVNVCSYHLQEAGATPLQEIAYALAAATAILDEVKRSRQVPDADLGRVYGRISFFVNAGIRFVTEMCKMRAFTELWDEIGRTRYGVTNEKDLLFRYGVQVNSLGLSEQQPENNVYRILLEMLAVTLSKNARARSVQLPAWNEALGLPRPWDQQWSLRAQQILALETDLLEFGDLFDGSPVINAKVEDLKREALAELAHIDEMGGAIKAVETGYIKERLVESNAARVAAIESGDQTVVGVNAYKESAEPGLAGGASARRHRRCLRRTRSDRTPARLAQTTRCEDGRRHARRPPPRGRRRPQHHGAVDRLRQSRRHDRRMGGRPPRRLRRIPCPDRRRRRTAPLERRSHRRPPRKGKTGRQTPGPRPDAAGGEARPRRPLERRRTNRLPRPRLRLRRFV